MPDELLPQISLTGAGADLDPAAVLSHALMQYQAGVRAEAEARVLAGPIDLGAEILQGILMEIAGGHLNLFRITAGVAFRVSIKHARARQLLTITEIQAAQQADDAAMNLGAYLAATSSNAVMDGYNLNINAKIPPKEAARRSVHAFGLTTPQMRTVFKLKDDGVSSSHPGAWRNLIDAFINRAFGMRIGALVDNSLRQVEADAIQKGWEDGLANGTISATATKVWVTAADEYTCPTCAPMDGVAVSIMDSFELPDGNRLKAPPVHVNCRCTVELREEDEEFGKAEDWDPRLHPRAQHGRFGTKVKPVMEAEETQDQMLAVVNQLLRASGLAPSPMATPGLQGVAGAPGLAAGPQMAAGPGLNQAQLGASPGLAGAKQAQVVGMQTHAVLGGQTVNLRRLNMAHQMQVAAVVADNVAHQDLSGVPADQLEPMSNRMMAFAAPQDLNIWEGYKVEGQLKGGAQINQPLRFVDRNNRADVREALDLAMTGMDRMFREDPYDDGLDAMAEHRDPGVQEAAAELRVIALAGNPKGRVRVAVTPEDASEAWRALLAPPGSGYRYSHYTLDAYDETGRTVASTNVTAATIAAMCTTHGHYRPHVVVAPYGGWKTSSGHGATDSIPGTDQHLLTGAFQVERINGVLVLTPDPEVFRRANPEHRPGN